MIDKVSYTAQFRRAVKKLTKKHYNMSRLNSAIDLILDEDHETLVHQYDWHTLVGNHAGINEIHLDKDWLLLYQIVNQDEVTLLLLNTRA